jgi:hypothetical protein
MFYFASQETTLAYLRGIDERCASNSNSQLVHAPLRFAIHR